MRRGMIFLKERENLASGQNNESGFEKKILGVLFNGKIFSLSCFSCLFLILSANPQSRPVVIIVFARVVRPSVRMSVPTFQNLAKQKQISSENNVHYCRDCEFWPSGSSTVFYKKCFLSVALRALWNEYYCY